jgi:hypothetical protein
MDVGLHLVILLLCRVLRSRTLVRLFFRNIAPLTVFRGWRVIGKSQRILTMKHEVFRHIEIEVFVRGSMLADTLRFVEELLQYLDGDSGAIDPAMWDRLESAGLRSKVETGAGEYTHHYPICVRRVLPDDTLISMASGGSEPWYAVSFVNYAGIADRDRFFKFARVLTATTTHLFGARPHWGKVCPLQAELVDQIYPQASEFREVCAKEDPNGVFRNAWIDDVVFARPADSPASVEGESTSMD